MYLQECVVLKFCFSFILTKILSVYVFSKTTSTITFTAKMRFIDIQILAVYRIDVYHMNLVECPSSNESPEALIAFTSNGKREIRVYVFFKKKIECI